MDGPVSADMPISQVVQQFPQVAEVFLEYGLHCVGCHISEFETVREGAMGHGFDEETLDMMLRDANALVLASTPVESTQSPRSQTFTVTRTAQDRFHRFLEQSNASFIRVSHLDEGFVFLLEETVLETDTIIIQDGIRFLLSEPVLEKLKQKVIDVEETLTESILVVR